MKLLIINYHIVKGLNFHEFHGQYCLWEYKSQMFHAPSINNIAYGTNNQMSGAIS